MKVATLEEVSTVISKGTTPMTLGHALLSKGIPFLRAEDVIGSSVNPSGVAFRISEDTNRLLSRSQLQPGDLLITIAGTLGRVGYVPANAPPMNCNQAVAFIRLRPEIIDVNYARHACQAGIAELLRLQKIGTIGNLNLEQVRGFTLPLPPLSEQKRIADVLERADRLRRTRRYIRELSETFIQSVFMQMFGDPATNPHGWEMATIDDVVALSQYGTSEKNNQDQRGYPILGMSNISYSGNLILDAMSHVELDKKEFEKLRLVPGDIIFNRTNSTELVGKTAYWNRSMDAVLASYLVKLRLKPNVLPEFFAAVLNTVYFKQLFQDRCKKAVGQSNISPTLLKEFPIYVPPLPRQETFAAVVRHIERLRQQQHEAKRQTEHLFRTLLHRTYADA